MRQEERQIKTAITAGWIDILIGLVMFLTGWHQWYFDHFHFFGIMGIGMLVYGTVHAIYYKREVKNG